MSNDFENLSIIELMKLIEKTSEILNDAKTKWDTQQEELIKVDEEIQPVFKQYNELIRRKRTVENTMGQMKPIIREKRKELEDAKHWLSRLQQAKLAQQKLEKLSTELDDFAPSMPWFTRAFKHQIDGAKRIALAGNGRTLLGDKRGLGKTLTALIACDFMKSRKIIVLAPKETIRNFKEEIKDWAPHRKVIDLIGQPQPRRNFMLDVLADTADEFILTMNLEAWRRDEELITKLIKLQADTVIIDEAHFIKETKTNMAQGVKRIVHAQNMCAMCGKDSLAFDGKNMVCSTEDCGASYKPKDINCMSVKHVIPMTGTMILNTPADLWVLLNLINEEDFRSRDQFLNRYCEPIGGGRYSFRPGGEAELVRKLGPSLIKRDRKSANVKIPPQKVQFIDIEFDKTAYPQQYRAYKELVEQRVIFSNSTDDQMAVNFAITLLLRLRQLIVWPESIVLRDPNSGGILFQCDVRESIKIDKAVELITELVEEGERVILFSQFIPPLKELEHRLKYTPVATQGDRLIKPALLYGQTSDAARAHIRYDLDAKNNSNDFDVVLGHYGVGGQSLNFTAATQMILLDREWNHGKEDQAQGRIDRIGQTKETTVHIPQVLDTVDTFMDKLIRLKKDISDGFEGEIDLLAQMNEAFEKGEM